MEVEPPGHFLGFSRPYLRYYEDEEFSFVFRQAQKLPVDKRSQAFERPAPVTLDVDGCLSVWDDMDAYRFYHVLRFFKTLEGFYIGTLDLSGRHVHRFVELTCTYLRLTDDLDAVRKTVREDVCQDTTENRRYVMTDEELWKRCRLKWKLPRVVDLGWLERQIQSMTKIMRDADGGKPRFQKLCLMDLPTELLDMIFSAADVRKVRLLASTCKVLNSIGASHLHHTRIMKLSFSRIENLLRIGEEPPTTELLTHLAMEQSEELIRLIDFLTSRRDLTGAIRNLTLCDEWKVQSRNVPAFRPHLSEPTFYDPIRNRFDTLLTSCRGVVCLCISGFAITSDWLRTISQLPKLRDLRLHCATIDDESVEGDILDGRIPTSPQVASLQWHDLPSDEGDDPPSRESGGGGLWHILLLLPNLVTFNHNLSHGVGWLANAKIQEKSDILCRGLRKLSLDLIWGLVHPWLTGWLRSTRLRTASPCTLTHFKLRTDRSISDGVILRLLECLHASPSPLEVLVIEGIRDGSVGLIERIAELFPDLIGLTLVRRENRLQRKTKLATWPYQSGEYALGLRGFRRLRYFGWNYRMDIYEATPSALLGFEERALLGIGVGGTDAQKNWSRPEMWSETADDEYFLDASTLALPFASCCPTLEIMGLENRTRTYFTISRGANGEVTTSGGYGFGGHANMDPRDWNPDEFHSGWKSVVPSTV
ncbi:hypothetical protein PQX77_010334 [Marasmius sp. AFHP31]|nr:hypothetical protein PQX77_010334 [Marasmius sp. AFHP31]